MGVCCANEEHQQLTSTTPRPVTPRPTTKPAKEKVSGRTGCGENGVHINSRIVGGKPADKGEWPWMAALLRDGDDQYCGGVLITNRHILTAAHCVDK